jgi:capsular polysaccharide biosynthesis protein
MNYPSSDKRSLFPFVLETLQIMGLDNKVAFVDKDTLYKKLYVSDSYTHGHNSNLPPRKEVYDLFNQLKKEALKQKADYSHPKKIYVSRRTWKHNKLDNIGTNYTSRRVLKNENKLVSELQRLGFKEVFTENMSMVEKINLFHRAEQVVGIIGGGLANSVFLPKKSKLYAIISPGFLDVNSRFIFSLNQQGLHLIHDTEHYEKTEFKKYMRVSFEDGYGEICDIEGDFLKVKLAKKNIAGWNNDTQYEEIKIAKKKCAKIDNGLNSAFILGIERTMEQIE